MKRVFEVTLHNFNDNSTRLASIDSLDLLVVYQEAVNGHFASQTMSTEIDRNLPDCLILNDAATWQNVRNFQGQTPLHSSGVNLNLTSNNWVIPQGYQRTQKPDGSWKEAPSYRDYCLTIHAMKTRAANALTDAEIVTEIRRICQGTPRTNAKVSNQDNWWLVTLAVTMFGAEVRRSKRAYGVALMLLDLIERRVGFGSRGKTFTWERVLYDVTFDANGQMRTRTENDAKVHLGADNNQYNAGHRWGGKFGMAHTGSGHQNAGLDWDNQRQATVTELKEASTIIHWLNSKRTNPNVPEFYWTADHARHALVLMFRDLMTQGA